MRVAGGRQMAEWNPGESALWSQRWVDTDGERPTTLLLRHPTDPYVRHFDAGDETELRKHAHAYLIAANQRADLELPKNWLDALAPGASSPFFGWLPIGWPSGTTAEPLASYRVLRKRTGGKSDSTVILLATESIPINGRPLVLGSEFGVRVVADARWIAKQNLHEVRFAGISVALPFGPYRAAGAVGGLSAAEAKALLNPLFKEKFKAAFARARKFDPKSVFWRGVRFTATQIEARGVGVGSGKARSDAIPYSFLLRYGPGLGDQAVTRIPLVADAVPGHAWVFPRDPASQVPAVPPRKRRVTRSEGELKQFRVEAKITNGQKDPLMHGIPEAMRVVVSPRFVRDDAAIAAGTAKAVDLPGTQFSPPIRSNDFSAVSSYRHVEQLFYRLNLYSIDPYAYFRIAQLPVMAVYRSGVRPGPGKDGQTVNARVLPLGWKADFTGPTNPGDRPTLEMHLALANRSHRARKPWDRANRSPAEPLGIAADSRWIWHEIGHVLLMASIGELEFRFAHSAGDALAAIVSDPQSAFANDTLRRGATFPWVFIPRRHDRCVLHGWSWCGSMHRALSQLPDADRLRRKGYRSEQILSSSLFRLYRCLGGDTFKDGATRAVAVRETASHYSVYLIIRGIQLLDPTVPPKHVDDFVTALMHADTLATEELKFSETIEGANENIRRIGGCAHKVIRGAFEAQGLYAADPAKITNAPGVAEDVDIYIKDGRPESERTPYGDIPYGPGSYVPVSLDWDLKQTGSSAQPGWQARKDSVEDAIALDPNKKDIHVTVGNRGSMNASNVTVRVWWIEWKNNTSPPEWDSGQWTEYDVTPPPAQDVPPGGARTFGPFTPPAKPKKRYLVLAQATCGGDRANTDADLPCARLSTPLVDLVANDNNLGLRVLGKP